MELARHPAQKMCGRVRVQRSKVLKFYGSRSEIQLGLFVKKRCLLLITVSEAVTQLSVRGETEESRIRKWQTRRDPSLHSG